METYIALLRGINIGGRNKIDMPSLKIIFEEIGFFDVRTYINSGNVIFTSEFLDKRKMIRKIESAVKAEFELAIPVVVISVKELSDSLKHAPEWWDTDKESVNYAIFLIPPMGIEEVFAAVGEAKPEYEKVDHYGSVIYLSAPLKTYSKAKWSKIASSSVNNQVTIRNANTVNKLLKLAQSE